MNRVWKATNGHISRALAISGLALSGLVLSALVLPDPVLAATSNAAQQTDTNPADIKKPDSKRPNIVYILADDLGWSDVGFHRGTPRTPHLDRLAAGGAMLNAFYAQPFSSQTRAALLTGRYPMRYGLQTLSIGPASDYGLPAEERTFAQALKESGYRTAYVGSWLLGHSDKAFWPTRRGFDRFYGTLAGLAEPVLRKDAKADWYRDERVIRESGYVTELLAAEAAAIIDKHPTDAPLLLVAAFDTPAKYWGAPQSLIESYGDISDDARRSYAAAVTALDAGVGKIVSALEKRGMLNDTLIVFQSDNGGAVPMRYPTGDGDIRSPVSDNGVFRQGKGSLYEGGVRVAALAHWPARIGPQTVITQPIHVTDMYIMLLTVGGASLDQSKRPDGVDALPIIADKQLTTRKEKEILLNVEAFHGALRAGEWKLIVHTAMPAKVELFQIANDPEEAENQAAAYPDRVNDMMKRLNEYAYDMAPAKYLGEAETDNRPMFWRENVPSR
jgi:arylsulfatase A-like enzyme